MACKALTQKQIDSLVANGCSADDWKNVQVADGFDVANVRNANFIGKVQIASNTGVCKASHAMGKKCGIYNATIINTTIGDGVRIANVGSHIANYKIADDVIIEDVGTMQTNAGATFGNGVEVAALNEGGGREIPMFNEMSSQFAYLVCLYRDRVAMVKKLQEMASKYAQSVKSDTGSIGQGAEIASVKEIVNVNVGPHAKICGASTLVNGTILSEKDAPTTIGANVVADDFIVAEGSSVTGGAIMGKTFVGQGCQMGKQYSSENSVFFANCEAFHGEGCSIFAGPYSVTHHKSTLMIAGMFSFYNAGSGTNQSNHMYKLGPVHEGKLERGCKTGSFSYMMWPYKVGPFSVILGKHTGTVDTSDFPFSHLDAKGDGRCAMVPGLHLTTVGTVRDGAKWPARDRRKGSVKRDIISFDVFSPYTIGKMIRGSDYLKDLAEKTDKAVEEVSVGGALVRRPILRTGVKNYRGAIEMYLCEKVVNRIKAGLESKKSIAQAMAADAGAVYCERWVDIGGQLMAQKRFDDLVAAIESGKIATAQQLNAELGKINSAYQADEWVWVLNAYKKVFDIDLTTANKDQLIAAAKKLLEVKGKFLVLVNADADKEFAEISRCGFGQDGSEAQRDADFTAVRGTYEDNKFVKEQRKNIETLKQQIEELEKKLAGL